MKKMCTVCGEREATLHYRESINGKETEWYLCPVCAKAKGIHSPSLFFGEEWGGFSPLMESFRLGEEKSAVCPRCKTTLSAVKKKGVFGCSACYDTFSPLLDMTPFIGQGYMGEKKDTTMAENPQKQASPKKMPTPEEHLAELKRELRAAVEAEQYEKAAKIRDEIRALEG